jgi:hypothetical protein
VVFQGKHQGIYLPRRDDNQQLKLFEFPMILRTDSPECTAFSDRMVSAENTTEVHFPLQLTQDQYDRFFHPEQRHALAETLYRKLLTQYGDALSLSLVEARFDERLTLAQNRYADATELDQETFALYRFYLGDRFDEHPEFQRLLNFYSLRQAIGEFHHQYRGREDELHAYQTPGWLNEPMSTEISS